jgi:hypothetical protein
MKDIKNNSVKADVSGSIRITKAALQSQRAIIPHCDWFLQHEYFTIDDDGEKIIFKKCYVEVPKRAYRLPKTGVFTILSEADLGTFNICVKETDDVDEVVVYYR